MPVSQSVPFQSTKKPDSVYCCGSSLPRVWTSFGQTISVREKKSPTDWPIRSVRYCGWTKPCNASKPRLKPWFLGLNRSRVSERWSELDIATFHSMEGEGGGVLPLVFSWRPRSEPQQAEPPRPRHSPGDLGFGSHDGPSVGCTSVLSVFQNGLLVV